VWGTSPYPASDLVGLGPLRALGWSSSSPSVLSLYRFRPRAIFGKPAAYKSINKTRKNIETPKCYNPFTDFGLEPFSVNSTECRTDETRYNFFR
jgi:hypothetical protein